MTLKLIALLVAAAGAAMLLRLYRPEFAMVLTLAAGAAALADSSNRVYTDGEYVIRDFENAEAMKRAFSA